MRTLLNMRVFVTAACLGILAGCVIAPPLPADAKFAAAETSIRAARSGSAPFEQRVANYLAAAAATASPRGTATEISDARKIYAVACAELTILLRSADGGRHWNQPLQVGARAVAYQLRFAPGRTGGAWSPNEFTSFVLAYGLSEKGVTTPNRRAGIGGELVGVRNLLKREPFALRDGIGGAVTATLDFHGRAATLTLGNPIHQPTVRVGGTTQPLAADFSAPLCYYRPGWSSWEGIEGGFFPGSVELNTGLYLLQPYDPKRIPVIFIHGLISTPEIWIDVLNKLQTDPALRERYQALVYWYPTGEPAAFTALNLRQAMAALEKQYAMPNGCLIVSHSLGGLLAQMQTTNLTKEDWFRAEGQRARDFFAKLKSDSEVMRGITFKANPNVKRVVFIATPHLGADLAVGTLAAIADRIISIPGSLAVTIKRSAGAFAALATGSQRILPNGVTSLSPKNPMLLTMAKIQVSPPCHSIIGNRGQPGPLAQSSDGIVPYWSSHLSYAKSEVIVPGPHSCYDYPESIAEIKRILHLHLAAPRAE